MTINPKIETLIGQDFIKEYLQRGFGIMNKTDVEVLVYWLLKKNGCLGGNITSSGMMLKITKSRAKSLDYQASLRYGSHDEKSLHNQVISCITNARFTAKFDKIEFAVEDEFLRNFISSKFYELNCYNDWLQNRDVFSVNIEFFTLFIDKYVYPDNGYKKDKDDFNRKIEMLRKQDPNSSTNSSHQPSAFIVNLAYILERIARGISEGVVSGTAGSGINSIFGVFGALTDVYNKAKELFSKK